MLTDRKYLRGAMLVTGCALALSPVHALADDKPLAKARTIQVQTKLSTTSGHQTETGEMLYTDLIPAYCSQVRIQKPNKIKMVTWGYGADAVKQGPNSVYAVSGDKEYIYDVYSKNSVTRRVTEDRLSNSLRRFSGINLILEKNPLAKFAQNVKRTITRTTFDGRPAILRTDILPAIKDENGDEAVPQEDIWFDAATKLPLRDRISATSRGKLAPKLQLDFSNWVIDKPIAATQFAFSVPKADKQMILKLTPLLVGSTAPDFETVTPNGKTVHLSDYKGKVVVLDFWATWCGPCQSAMPHLESVYHQLRGQNAEVLAICVMDQQESYDKWRPKNIGPKYHFPVAFDSARQAVDRYRLTSIPHQLVVGPDGRIVSSEHGYEQDSHELEKTLRKLGLKVTDTQD